MAEFVPMRIEADGFWMYSYRPRQPLATIQDFEQHYEWLCSRPNNRVHQWYYEVHYELLNPVNSGSSATRPIRDFDIVAMERNARAEQQTEQSFSRTESSGTSEYDYSDTESNSSVFQETSETDELEENTVYDENSSTGAAENDEWGESDSDSTQGFGNAGFPFEEDGIYHSSAESELSPPDSPRSTDFESEGNQSREFTNERMGFRIIKVGVRAENPLDTEDPVELQPLTREHLYRV